MKGLIDNRLFIAIIANKGMIMTFFVATYKKKIFKRCSKMLGNRIK